MTMTAEEGETFRKELDSFWLRQDLNRIEFTLRNWHVVMYRIGGQKHLVRVDFQRRDIEPKLKAYGPRILHSDVPIEVPI